MINVPMRWRAAAAAFCAVLALSACERQPGEVQPPSGSNAPAPVPAPVPATPSDTTPTTPVPPASAASQ